MKLLHLKSELVLLHLKSELVRRSYVYHALHSYFDRDNVALPNIAKYFNEQVSYLCNPAWPGKSAFVS